MRAIRGRQPEQLEPLPRPVPASSPWSTTAQPASDGHREPQREATPTVSVVICARDAAPFVDAALASIVAQTRPADEVVVVDDASVDDTAAAAERWAGVSR